jgi:hypothetical protein
VATGGTAGVVRLWEIFENEQCVELVSEAKVWRCGGGVTV